ncbi:MAG TPA: hypothetical protein VNN62_07370 [Methylomirabilota bacterium]|jgi:hypothetical protein|nr:hypothetical protein [Methylomirabilota bacterium]
MRVVYPLLLITLLLAGACSYIFPPKKVECCENKAGCCFEEMCCLPRYALAAGKEPKPFTTNIPTYGVAREEDLQPPPGAVIVKKGWLARWNPFGSDESEQKPREQPSPQDKQASADKEDKGFWGRLWPF